MAGVGTNQYARRGAARPGPAASAPDLLAQASANGGPARRARQPQPNNVTDGAELDRLASDPQAKVRQAVAYNRCS